MAWNCHFLWRVASYSQSVLMCLKFGSNYSMLLLIEVARNCHILWWVASYSDTVSTSWNLGVITPCHILLKWQEIATFFKDWQVIATLYRFTWTLGVATPCHSLLKWQEIDTFFEWWQLTVTLCWQLEIWEWLQLAIFYWRVASYSQFVLMYLKFGNCYSMPLFTEVERNCHILW